MSDEIKMIIVLVLGACFISTQISTCSIEQTKQHEIFLNKLKAR